MELNTLLDTLVSSTRTLFPFLPPTPPIRLTEELMKSASTLPTESLSLLEEPLLFLKIFLVTI